MKRFPAGILATRCIPWTERGAFDAAMFRSGLRDVLSRGTKHLYLFGTAGEGHSVSDRQFDEIVGLFVDEMTRAAAEPMVGVISLSLGTLCERIDRARALGVRLFQIAFPAWGALHDHELDRFFEHTCGRFSDCRFLHYNLMRTKRVLTGREYGRFAERYPNLVATKNTTDGMAAIQSLIEEAPQLQHFLSERGYAFGSQFGECGLLASLVMNWPRLRELFDAGQRRDVATLTTIQRECQIVLKTLFEVVPEGRIDGAYDKLFEKMYDRAFPLRLLPPYVGSTDEEFTQFVRLLHSRLPDWVPATARE